MASTTASIRAHIEQLPPGDPFTASSLLSYGTRAAVDQALSRLAKSGYIERVTRGVYVRPKVSPYVGKVPPEPLKVVKAIAKEHGEVVQVHGAEAARRLALSTQAPTQPVFLTSGPSRSFRLGNLEVTLKHVKPRRLALAERQAGLALTALWYLGEEQVTASVLNTIREQLPPEEFQALREATNVMPVWMADAFHHYEAEQSRG
jgi:hypothetical protein